MKKLIRKDKIKRLFFKNYELKKVILKHIRKNNCFNKHVKWNVALYLTKDFLPIKSSRVQFSNRCIFTGRSNRLNKYFNVSRIAFLRLARSKKIFKLTESKW